METFFCCDIMKCMASYDVCENELSRVSLEEDPDRFSLGGIVEKSTA